ncbi:uncharacterized protein LOC143463551 [Clavelina lepadiformis]|uniref:uncharacterized protein LOC143463551 n=1 Tax=Clavelina lepadiformis TaxID=159417 RepID=UPI00404377D3
MLVRYNITDGPAGNTVTRGCSSNAVPYCCLTIFGGRSCTSTCDESGCNNKVFELHQQMQTGRGISLRCYQCNYSSKNGQNDCYGRSISSDYLQNCPNANDRYCLTTITNSQDSVIGNTITRGCSTTTAINGCGATAGISSCLSTCSAGF